MPKYQILSPLQRNRELHTKGVITMSEQDAEPLLKIGVLGAYTSSTAAGDNGGQGQQGMSGDQDGSPEPGRDAHADEGLSERELALRAAVAELLAGDPEQVDPALWTKARRPDLKAIRKHPELRDATRDEVDAAFSAVRADG